MSPVINYASPPPPYHTTTPSLEIGLPAEQRKSYQRSVRRKTSSLKYLAVTVFISFLFFIFLIYHFVIKSKPADTNFNETDYDPNPDLKT